MKKVGTLLSIILLTALLCGCENTTEQRVEKQFRMYVKENFDEPGNLDEVISITKKDSVDFTFVQESCIMLLNVGKQALETDSITREKNSDSSLLESMKRKLNNQNKSILEEWINASEKHLFYMQYGGVSYGKAKKDAQDIVNMTNPIKLVHYEIKARVKIGDGKNLNIYHGYLDKDGNIKILDHEMVRGELPESLKNAMDILDNLTKETEILINEVKSYKEAYEKMEIVFK